MKKLIILAVKNYNHLPYRRWLFFMKKYTIIKKIFISLAILKYLL